MKIFNRNLFSFFLEKKITNFKQNKSFEFFFGHIWYLLFSLVVVFKLVFF
jgi:hypothetical protein